MRLTVVDHAEADAAWRMLAAVPDDLFQPVEIHLDGRGLLWRVVRAADGGQISVPVAAQQGHSPRA